MPKRQLLNIPFLSYVIIYCYLFYFPKFQSHTGILACQQCMQSDTFIHQHPSADNLSVQRTRLVRFHSRQVYNPILFWGSSPPCAHSELPYSGNGKSCTHRTLPFPSSASHTSRKRFPYGRTEKPTGTNHRTALPDGYPYTQ